MLPKYSKCSNARFHFHFQFWTRLFRYLRFLKDIFFKFRTTSISCSCRIIFIPITFLVWHLRCRFAPLLPNKYLKSGKTYWVICVFKVFQRSTTVPLCTLLPLDPYRVQPLPELSPLPHPRCPFVQLCSLPVPVVWTLSPLCVAFDFQVACEVTLNEDRNLRPQSLSPRRRPTVATSGHDSTVKGRLLYEIMDSPSCLFSHFTNYVKLNFDPTIWDSVPFKTWAARKRDYVGLTVRTFWVQRTPPSRRIVQSKQDLTFSALISD